MAVRGVFRPPGSSRDAVLDWRSSIADSGCDSAGNSLNSSVVDSSSRLSSSWTDCRPNCSPDCPADGFPGFPWNRRLNGSPRSSQDCPRDSAGDCLADGHLHRRLDCAQNCVQDNLGNGLENPTPDNSVDNLQSSMGDEIGYFQAKGISHGKCPSWRTSGTDFRRTDSKLGELWTYHSTRFRQVAERRWRAKGEQRSAGWQ
jgi:hypothetical protein